MQAFFAGINETLPAIFILLLTWSLSGQMVHLGTSKYIVYLLGDGFPAGLLPATVFVLAAAMSFATGSSWGTMAVMFPVAIPLSDALSPGDGSNLTGTTAAILAGSVFGDHCSPISDTTIMTSLMTGCKTLNHVKTQLPYALLMGGLSFLVGNLPTGFGLYNEWVAIAIGIPIIFAIILLFGTPLSNLTLDKYGCIIKNKSTDNTSLLHSNEQFSKDAEVITGKMGIIWIYDFIKSRFLKRANYTQLRDSDAKI